MRQLMISLDKQIAQEGSRVANRMELYGKQDELFILIPDRLSKAEFMLGDKVHVEVVGGSNKLIQGYRVFRRGRELIKKHNIIFVTTQDPFFTGLIGVFLKFFRRRIKLEIQLHGDFFGSDYYRDNHLIRYFLCRINIKIADKVRVASRRSKESLIKKLIMRTIGRTYHGHEFL